MAEQFNSLYFRGQGKVFIGDIDASGNPVSLAFIGDVSAAKISSNISRGKHIESVSGGRAVAASWIDSSEFGISLTLHSVRKDHLANAIQGTATAKTGASVTDESHTANLDKFVMLDNVKISSVVVTNSAGTTTYTANTDYIVHADEGLIEVVSGGNITDGSTILVDYTYATQDHITTSPGNVAKYLMFSGINTANNDKVTRCEAYRVKFDPAALDLITTEAAGMEISGIIEQDTTRAAGDQYYKWKNES